MATTFAVPDGRVAMAATTWTGNDSGANRSISNAVNGVGFQPDLFWEKSRNYADDHILADSIRGLGYTHWLIPDSTAAEGSYYSNATLNSFDSAGFTIAPSNGGTNILNVSSRSCVAWQWKAGGTAVSNTAGTITSSVSANTTAGFSVVTFTGNGVNTSSGVATVGHGLGVVPSFIITKKRSSGTDYNWSTYHISNGNANIWLNTASAKNPSNWVTAPAANVFTPPVSLYGNESGVNYVAYCWAPVAGYSAFGSYTGNGSADGTFIYTGFRPRYVLIKRTDVSADWFINDTSREPYNLMSVSMRANTADTEASGGGLAMDALSNGFKMKDAGSGSNASGGTYIYAAFAENPLKYANAR